MSFSYKKLLVSIALGFSLPTHTIASNFNGTVFNASIYYQELKTDITKTLNIPMHVPIFNTTLLKGMFAGAMIDQIDKMYKILIDEEQLKYAPIGVKRWIIGHELAHIAHGDCEKLNTEVFDPAATDPFLNFSKLTTIEKYSLVLLNVLPFFCYEKLGLIKGLLFHMVCNFSAYASSSLGRKALKSLYQVKQMEKLADTHSIELLECEQCVEDCASWLSKQGNVIAMQARYIIGGYLTPQQIRSVGHLHKGKVCKNHTK